MPDDYKSQSYQRLLQLVSIAKDKAARGENADKEWEAARKSLYFWIIAQKVKLQALERWSQRLEARPASLKIFKEVVTISELERLMKDLNR